MSMVYSGIYTGIFLLVVGAFMTIFLNRNVKVPISGDWDMMPMRIKVGIVLVILGVLLTCISIGIGLVLDPLTLLMPKGRGFLLPATT